MSHSALKLAALLLSGSLVPAFAQAPAPPAPDAAPAAPTQPAAPIERHAPRPPRMEAPRDHGPRTFVMRREGGEGGFHYEMGPNFRIAPMGTWWRNPDVVQRLTLTPEQTKKMDDIVQDSRLKLIDLRANVERQNLLLEPMLSANPIDQNKVLAQIDKVAQARAELEKANARMLLGIRGVLTPEQWTKLQSHDRERFHGAMPQGPGGPGMPKGPGGAGPRGPGADNDFVAPEPPLL